MTLIDSRRDIAAAVAHAASRHGARTIREQEVFPWIGKGLRIMFKGLLPDSDKDRIGAMVETYKERFFDRCAVHSMLYPGVTETLEELKRRGIMLAVATTKMTFMARRVCEAFGLDRLVDHVQGTDDFPEKPDPAVLLAACKALGAPASEAVAVGDTVMDVRAAKKAGCFSAAVNYGIGSREELAAAKPDILIDSFEGILTVFD